MEQYYEQNVVNYGIDNISKRTRILSILRMICFGLSIAILFLGITMLNWILAIAAIPSFAVGCVLGHYNKRANTEYDYVLDNEKLCIAEIYYRMRRKQKYKISLRSIESVGAYGSDGYKRAAGSVKKKHLALVNFDDEKTVLYIVYKNDKGKFMIFLEPDRTFMLTLRRVVSAIQLFDSSVSELERCLSVKQAEIIAAVTKKSVSTSSSDSRSDSEEVEETQDVDDPQNESAESDTAEGGE